MVAPVLAFFVVAAVGQAGLGVALLRRGATRAAVVVALLFLANALSAGLNAAHESGAALPGPWDTWLGGHLLDALTAGLVAMLAAIYPRRGSWLRWPPVVDWVVFLVPAAVVLATAPLGWNGLDYGPATSPTVAGIVLRYLVPSVPWIILLTRWTGALEQRERGAPTRQFALVFAAFGMRAVHMGLLIAVVHAKRAFEPGASPVFVPASILVLAAAAAAVWALIRISMQARQGVAASRLVLAFLLAGVFEACVSVTYTLNNNFSSPSVQTDLMVVRPILVWLAVGEGFGIVGWRPRPWQAWPLGALAAAGLAVQLDQLLERVIPGETIRWLLATVVAVGAVVAIGSTMGNLAPWRRRLPTVHAQGAWPKGTVVAQHFRVERLVGAGELGRVYEAVDTRTLAPVLLKHAPAGEDAALHAVTNEARSLSRVRHANIVHLVALAEADGQLLVLERLEGGDLRARVARGRLRPEEVLEVGHGLLSGLEAMHAVGLAHRDVSPATVQFAADGSLRLTGLTYSGAMSDGRRGTAPPVHGGERDARYRAPEQLHGKPGDARTDVYGAAVVLAECLVGRPLMAEGLPEFEVTRAVERGLETDIPASVPSALRLAVLVGLDPLPERRWATPAAFRRALSAVGPVASSPAQGPPAAQAMVEST